jgi:hypothetical protein
VAATRDLPTIAFFRAGVLLRRSVPVPGILATHRPGAAPPNAERRTPNAERRTPNAAYTLGAGDH